MPLLEAQIQAEKREDLVAGEFGFAVVFTNNGSEPTRLNVHQASHPALVLDVRDKNDREVLLPPPSAPDAEDLEEGNLINPGESISIDYLGFLDRSLAPGEYKVRYFGEFPALGGTKEDPLRSDWMTVTLRPERGFEPGISIPNFKPTPDDPGGGPFIPLPGPLNKIWVKIRDLMWWLRCLILRWLLRRPCGEVRAQEIDQARTETISNAPAGSEAWNGTYSWRARFLLTLDEPACTARVLILGPARRDDHRGPALGVGVGDRGDLEQPVQALPAELLLFRRAPDRDRHPVRDIRRAPRGERRRKHGPHDVVGRVGHGRRVSRGWPHARRARRVLHGQRRELGRRPPDGRRDHEQPGRAAARPPLRHRSPGGRDASRRDLQDGGPGNELLSASRPMGLVATLTIEPAEADAAELFVATCTLANTGDETLSINVAPLLSPSLLLQIEDAAGAPYYLPPPPVPPSEPPIEPLAAGAVRAASFAGFLPSWTEPGAYRACCRYVAGPGEPIVSDWVEFRLRPQARL